MMMCSRFFIKLMTTPYTGPSAKAPSRAGRSEKSILTKDGMSIGSGNSMNIRIKATALSMAATVRLWVVFFFMVVVLPGVYAPFKFVRKALFALDRTGKTNQKTPCCNQKLQQGAQTQFACRFLHPDYTVGPGVAPGQHPCGWSRTLPPVGNCTPP